MLIRHEVKLFSYNSHFGFFLKVSKRNMYDMYKHDREDTNGQTNKVKAVCVCVCWVGVGVCVGCVWGGCVCVCVGGGGGWWWGGGSLLNEIKKKKSRTRISFWVSLTGLFQMGARGYSHYCYTCQRDAVSMPTDQHRNGSNGNGWPRQKHTG